MVYAYVYIYGAKIRYFVATEGKAEGNLYSCRYNMVYVSCKGLYCIHCIRSRLVFEPESISWRSLLLARVG